MLLEIIILIDDHEIDVVTRSLLLLICLIQVCFLSYLGFSL